MSSTSDPTADLGAQRAQQYLQLVQDGRAADADALVDGLTDLRELAFLGAGFTAVARSLGRTLPPAMRAQASTRQVRLGQLRDRARGDVAGLRGWLHEAGAEVRALTELAARVAAAASPGGSPSGQETGRSEPTAIVVMGVSGSGKTSVARELTDRLGWEYIEGDDLHPAENVAKMAGGTPLTDADRWPWLRRIAEVIGEHEAAGRSLVLTCSALKRTYRDLLREGHPAVWFAHVDVPRDVLADRLAKRTDHYMPPSLLDSQLAALEPLAAGEPGAVVDGAGSLDQTVTQLIADLQKDRGPVQT